MHHDKKVDAPAGAAITTGKDMLEVMPDKDELAHVRYGDNAKRPDNVIDVVAARIGKITANIRSVFSPKSSDYARLVIGGCT